MARKKSIRGGGSVFQRQDGRWEAKFKVEETGKYKSLYAHSEKDAYKLLEEAKYQQKQGMLATGPQQTVKQFLEYWLEDVEKPTIRPTTYVNNRIIVHKHFIAELGHIQLQKLTSRHLQGFYAKKLKDGLSASRVVRLNAVLHKALDHAKRLKLVGANVAEDIDLPTPHSPDIEPLTPEQAQLFLKGMKERHLEALLTVAITTAMRKGEILGLHWSDIDFDKGVLRIRRTLSYIAGQGFIEGNPKTAKSKREIVLPQFVVELLKQHRATQDEMRNTAGASWQNRDLVFCTDHGYFISASTLWYQFDILLKKIGLPHMRFHNLRHSAATLLLSMGVPEKVVQELLGHTNNAQTIKYLHVLPSMQKEAMDKMDKFFKKE